MVVIMANMGFWSTLAADMPSLSRFFKAPKMNAAGSNAIKHSWSAH